ncbi:hypothetical protein, partial [Azotobacter vinelandii]|uniref:hypothetical protein n=1 Tax=Azotobacter vinelandii TaxID=354 RepID=UPI00090F6E5B
IGVQMHQTWDPVGKFGPTIRDTVFLNSSPTTTAATCISISGVWSANIQGSYFFGKGAGGGPTTGIGGYGIRFSLTSNASSSSMNITISDNIFITIANAIYTDDRILVAGGRIEGLRIADNNIIAGQYGIRTAQVLALSISGNQISDFYIAILSIADFDVSITGNTEITGLYSGIVISADEDGITERYSITANNIGSNDICIRFSNVIADGVLRSITITANTFRGIVSTAKGVAVEGAYGVSGASVCANIFWSLAYGIWCGPSSDIVSSANQYYSVAVKVFGGTVQGIRSYSESRSITLTGGAATETINIAIPAGYFDSAPDSAYMTSNTDMITGFYNYDGSSATSLQFVVRRADGATISSVARRFSISAFDSGY